METQLTVSQLGRRTGVSPDTLRYYERIGLIPPPDRSAAGYRLYDEAAEERVRFIKRAQRFALSLDAIRELLAVRERGACPCGHTHGLLKEKVAALDEQLASLQQLRAEILTMIDNENGKECLFHDHS